MERPLTEEEIIKILILMNQIHKSGQTKDEKWKYYNDLLKRQPKEVVQKCLAMAKNRYSPAQQIPQPNYQGMNPQMQMSQSLPPQQNLTELQLQQIRNQVMAAKHLSRNAPVPSNIISNARGIPAAVSVQQTNLLGFPIQNLNADILLQKREERISEKIEKRISQLENLPSDLAPHLLIKAMIELKQLKLLNFQKKLRQKVVGTLHSHAVLSSASQEPLSFKKSALIRRENVGQLFDKEQMMMREQQERSINENFMTSLMEHANKFKEFHFNHLKLQKSVNKNIEKYWSNKEKREAQKKEREYKERLKMLKEDNEEAYLNLLKETKNDRVKHLIEQTTAYLQQLTGLIVVEKKSIASKDPKLKKKKKDEESEEEEEEKVDKSSSIKEYYYKLAHTQTEKITKQPDLMKGGKLKPYQIVGLEWLVSLYNNNLNGILADEMGLGKTIQTISLIAYLIEKKNNPGPFLIIVPLSTLPNWVNEFTTWTPSISLVVYKGLPADRKQLYKDRIRTNNFNVMITTYDYVLKDKASLTRLHWSYIIIDEGHRMKNAQSKLNQLLTNNYHTQHRLILTGTPLQNSLSELWSLLNFLLPSIFNSSISFDQWFSAPFEKMGEKNVEMNEEESLLVIRRLHQILRPFLLRRLKSDVESQLPQKIEKVLRCELSEWQKIVYNRIKEEGLMQSEKGAKGMTNALMEMRMICNHPYLCVDSWEYDSNFLRLSGKFDLLDRVLPLLLAGGHRVLIFNQFKYVMDLISLYFEDKGIKFLRLDGDTKSESRGTLLEQFNKKDSEYNVFILSTRAGGQGLNLQSADTVIIFDSDWNPQMDQQAQARVHRIGQTKEVLIIRFVSANSIEETILSRANHKLGMDQKIIGAGMFNTTAKDQDRKAALQEILKEEQNRKDQQEIPTEKQICSMIARTEDEYELFLKLDEQRKEKELKEARQKGLEAPIPRLITREELPKWLTTPVQRKDLGVVNVEEYGRGMREKKMDYSEFADFFGDETETKIEDNSNQNYEDKEERKEEEKAKQKKAQQEQNKIESNSNNSSLLFFWEKVRNLKDGDDFITQDFLTLPSRKDYPDYYEVIEEPIDLEIIRKKIESNSYFSPQQFVDDLFLLCDNATTYNEKASQIHSDALAIKKFVSKESKSLFKQEKQEKEEKEEKEMEDEPQYQPEEEVEEEEEKPKKKSKKDSKKSKKNKRRNSKKKKLEEEELEDEENDESE